MRPIDIVDSKLTRGTLAVCVATYNRNDQLLKLLATLDKVSAPSVLQWTHTVIVDNSPDGAARDTVESFQGRGAPVRYVHEATPGLSAARNCAVRSAQTEFIAFIDDDELPSTQWLVELTNSLSDHPQAVAVMGPVDYEYASGVAPQWLEQTRLFEPISLTSGEPPSYLATGNLLLRTDLVDSLGTLFDPQFGLTGGEDHQLGLRLERAGLTVLSSPDAHVRELVPLERIQPAWAARRLLRKGASLATTQLSLEHGARRWWVRCRSFAVGGARLLVGLGQALTTPFVPQRTLWHGGRQFLMGCGQMLGALNLSIREYRR